MALAAGTRLGPYEILASLGAGGRGEVYHGRDTRLDRAVATKILPSHLLSNPGRRQRFEREAKTISRLIHPHICTLHETKRAALVMACIPLRTAPWSAVRSWMEYSYRCIAAEPCNTESLLGNSQSESLASLLE